MNQHNNNRHNKIDYIEFPASETGAAKHFYSSVFGWKFTDYGPAYTSFEDGRLTGGFQANDAAASHKPLVVLYAQDLEACLAAVQTGGGKIVREIFAFPGGRRFHFADPAGNELAVWSE